MWLRFTFGALWRKFEAGSQKKFQRDLWLQLLIGCSELEMFVRCERPLLASLHSLDMASVISGLV